MLQSYIQYGPPIVFCIQYNPTYCQWLQVVPNLGKNEAGAGIAWFIVVHSTALCRFLLLFILQIESFWQPCVFRWWLPIFSNKVLLN